MVDQTGEEVEAGFIRLLDDQTFEVVHSFALDPMEQPISCISCSFEGDDQVFLFVCLLFLKAL